MQSPDKFVTLLIVGVLSLFAASTVVAQDTTPEQVAQTDTVRVVDLDVVTVTGVQPGPGLWHVTKGDHQLWIMGVLSPLPSQMEWNSVVVRKRVAESQQVILEPVFTINTDTGFFKSIYLGYKFYQVTKNPDRKKLVDVLPPEVYRRWEQAKRRYMPRDRGVERRRPLVAADELFDAAIKRSGLSRKLVVEPTVKETAKANDIPLRTPRVNVTIKDPKSALAAASRVTLQDTECLVATLDAIDQDLPRMITNANAWAEGDVDRISLAQIERRNHLCSDAFSNSELTKELGIPDVRVSSKEKWMNEVMKALSSNEQTFSIVPLQDILGPDGYAAELAAKGYSVQTP
ncbi:MAG: TraB/GumN family protein [Burkholderiales bacterium]